MFFKLLKYSNVCQRCYSDFKKFPYENPVKRVLRIFGNDYKSAKAKILNQEANLSHYEYDNSDIENFPSYVDVVIIGGGVMGSSIAYWLKEKSCGTLGVAVIEKDLTYTKSSTVLSVGGIRQQFSLPENIEMSQFGAEFLRKMKHTQNIDVQFTPRGYLLLADEEHYPNLEKNYQTQQKYNVKNELLSPKKLKSKFPWLNTEDIAGGCLGLENEGWFDPWTLLSGLKGSAMSMGTQYTEAEAVGFGFKEMPNVLSAGSDDWSYKRLSRLYVKTKDGKLREINFAKCIIAAGAHSGKVAEMANIGVGAGILSLPLPVEPRKRYVYCFNSKDENIPGIDSPMILDPSGAYFRREGLGTSFIGGKCPSPGQEPSIDTLDVDHDFFYTEIWPRIAHRIPAFEGIKVTGAWAGYYDYNTYDENGIIGVHPHQDNLYFATGFSGHGIQQAPAVGRAIAELMLDGMFMTIDLTRLGFDRFILNYPMYETNIY